MDPPASFGSFVSRNRCLCLQAIGFFVVGVFIRLTLWPRAEPVLAKLPIVEEKMSGYIERPAMELVIEKLPRALMDVDGDSHAIHEARRQFVITSATYFKKTNLKNSTDTVAIGVHGVLADFAALNLTCVSWRSESGSSRRTSVVVRRSIQITDEDTSSRTFVAKCETVSEPDDVILHFPVPSDRSNGTAEGERSEKTIALPLRSPSQEKLSLVSCVAPITTKVSWLQSALSIEFYAHAGVMQQVHYFASGSSSHLKMLKEYANLGLITLHPWSVPPSVGTSFPLLMADSALTDCFSFYRNAADFILVHAVDDFLLTPSGRNLYDEFRASWRADPLPIFVAYGKYSGAIAVARGGALGAVDVEKSFASASIVRRIAGNGNVVFNVSQVDLAVFPHRQEPRKSFLAMEDGFSFAVRNWGLKKRSRKQRVSNRITKTLSNSLRKQNFSKVSASLNARLQWFEQNTELTKMIASWTSLKPSTARSKSAVKAKMPKSTSKQCIAIEKSFDRLDVGKTAFFTLNPKVDAIEQKIKC